MKDRAAQGHRAGRQGSLFGLLVGSYLLFMAVLLLLAFGVYLLWGVQIDHATATVDAQFGITDAESFEALSNDAMIRYSQVLEQADRNSMMVWLLLIPLYLVTTGLFILWMRSRIGKPLERLNDAVEAQLRDRRRHFIGTDDALHGSALGGTDDASHGSVLGKTDDVLRGSSSDEGPRRPRGNHTDGSHDGPREIVRIAESFDALSAQLAVSERERRRLDEERQKLIADISHDLKTPITVISGYADALCAGKVPPDEQDRYLRAIQQKSVVLVELIDTFSEYGKVEHPQFKLERERTDLCEYMRTYLARRYDEIDLEGFSLEVDIPERPLFVSLDELQFRRVLDNLLSNSLKHNRLGTVMSIDVIPSGNTAVLLIADNGVRIRREYADRIFEPFVTGDAARSKPGTGLGLSISRRIVELHGGTIELSASPRPGRTNEFKVTLPLIR